MRALELDSEEGRQRIARLYRYAQIGHCVNAVTHDVNNFLGAIMAYAELIGMESPLNEESARMIEEIMGAVRKSSSLVNNLTSIARKERPNANMVDPGQLVERVVELRQYDFRTAQIGLECICEPNLPMMVVDAPKLEMAIIYLLSNAMDAARDATPRLVRVKVRAEGDNVVIEVWNSGDPVPEDIREAVFEPFFTTKDSDHLGLGLTIARDIARQHHGDLYYEPKRGFAIELPREAPTAPVTETLAGTAMVR